MLSCLRAPLEVNSPLVHMNDKMSKRRYIYQRRETISQGITTSSSTSVLFARVNATLTQRDERWNEAAGVILSIQSSLFSPILFLSLYSCSHTLSPLSFVMLLLLLTSHFIHIVSFSSCSSATAALFLHPLSECLVSLLWCLAVNCSGLGLMIVYCTFSGTQTISMALLFGKHSYTWNMNHTSTSTHHILAMTMCTTTKHTRAQYSYQTTERHYSQLARLSPVDWTSAINSTQVIVR